MKTIAAVTTLVALGALAALVPALAEPQSCHLREFDLCLTSAIVFVQQPQGTRVSEREIERQCELFKETEQCLDEYSERCMSQSQNALVDFMSGGVLRYMRDYCRKGSDLRRLYLKHGECVNKQRKNLNKCLVDFQSALEKATQESTHWKDRPKTLCCALDRMKECNTRVLEPVCGREAVEVGNMLVQGTFSRGATLSCKKYEHTSPLCQSLMPPTDTKPKGAKSNSVLSKLMSTITQI